MGHGSRPTIYFLAGRLDCIHTGIPEVGAKSRDSKPEIAKPCLEARSPGSSETARHPLLPLNTHNPPHNLLGAGRGGWQFIKKQGFQIQGFAVNDKRQRHIRGPRRSGAARFEHKLHKLHGHLDGSRTSRPNSRDIPGTSSCSLGSKEGTNLRGRERAFRPPPLRVANPPYREVSGPRK